jgi:hypothetical protein
MKKLLARPILSAAASFVGIFAGELARSRTSCQYVEASKKINTTLMRRKRKYLHCPISLCYSTARKRMRTFSLVNIQSSSVPGILADKTALQESENLI